MKVLVMGCGRVGAQLATSLDAEGHQVTILDIDPSSFDKLPPSFKGTTLLGSGTDEDSLREAGIEEVDAFVALTRGDSRNIMSAQIAKYMFNVPRVICRIYDPLYEELYQTLGLEAISLTAFFAQLLKEKLLK
jgi:trk system potassium uptake protein TrkA